MKKLFLGMAVLGMALGFASCNKIKQAQDAVKQVTDAVDAASGNKEIAVNYRMFENKEESKKLFDEVIAKLGTEINVVDEVTISIDRPSEGRSAFKKEGDTDKLYIKLHTQDPTNNKRIRETRYYSKSGGWQPSEQMEINVIGGNAEKFKLEDDLFDFSKVSSDLLFQVATDAYAKYKDTAKYEYQYIRGIDINKKGIEVSIYGKLASNEQEKKNYYKTDLTGKARK